jgi:uncharacterized repeat protein (TIGR01451 family)
MKSSIVLQGLAAVCFAATASAVFGQNAIQLFSPANLRYSTQGTSYGSASVTFNNSNLSLSCTAPITAKLSSSPSGTGKVLVDNYISLGISGGTPTDICSGGTVENGAQHNCFTSSYADIVSSGDAVGQDPDTFLPAGGVPPIDISKYLKSGTNQISIGTVDTGYSLASSTLYLVTSCMPNGVSGPGNVIGNPIASTNPTSSQLTQNYMFNSFNTQQVGFTFDLSEAHNSGQLSITNGTVPSTADITLNPATFQSTYLHGTSFATASCLPHTGEIYDNAAACKLYTVTCQVGTNPAQSGALCPSSLSRNEIFQDTFDGPPFSMNDVPGLHGGTFHLGVGFIEANEGWAGGTCVFDPASAIASELCPQNLLTNFSGPGIYESGGRGQSTNSTFITVYGVPEDLTTVNVTELRPGNWINSHTASVNFVSTPPAVASSNNFIAAPIQSLTYGISPSSSVPQPGPPVPDDITVDNSACPAPGQGFPAASPFTPSTQSISVPEDGNYTLHYYAQDCAGTEELKFTQTAGSWSTSFYTFPINVDTAPPVVATPTLSPSGGSYSLNQKVTATFRCTDALSGIVQCGTNTYAPGATQDTGNLTATIDTSKAGPQTFTVTAVDAAGNQSTASVNYTVNGAPVNLGVLKLAPLTAKQATNFIYSLTVGNLSLQTASSVVITDVLPSGVSFVSASASQLVCTNQGCSNPAKCSTAASTVTCTTPSLSLISPVEVLITVKATAAVGAKINNKATVSSANPEQGNPTSNTVTTVVTK